MNRMLWILILLHFKTIECSANKVFYALALPGESQTEACVRKSGLAVPSTYIDRAAWNITALKAIAATLNLPVSPSRSAIKGCCSSGMWCDRTGCFTQSYGRFSNYGWLNGDNQSVPVYSCFSSTDYAMPVITSASYASGYLTLTGNNFQVDYADYSATSVSIGTEQCGNVEVCNSHQCQSCMDNSCSLDSVCLVNNSGGSASCYMYCGGPTDASCPCGSFCDTVTVFSRYDATSTSLSLSLCTYQSFHTYSDGTCPLNNKDSIICKAPRASQKQATTSTSWISLSVFGGAEYVPALIPYNLPPAPWCASNSDCFDGNVCTADTCVVGYCTYSTVIGCSSMSQSVRERVAPYIYSIFSQKSKLVYHAIFEYQMESSGRVIALNTDSSFVIQNIKLPFSFPYFGASVSALSVLANGAVSLTPIPVCPGTVTLDTCITFSTISNTIAPYFSQFDFTLAGSSRVILLPQVRGDNQNIYNIDATAYHILFQDFRNSSDLTGVGATFSASIYSDGSIRYSYIVMPLQGMDPVTDYVGLWGSRMSTLGHAYNRYHQEAISFPLVTQNGGGNDIIFCPLPNIIACAVETCVSGAHPLLLVWGAGVQPTCYASITPVLACVWGGLAVTSPTFVTPTAAQRALGGNGNWTKLLSCPVPFLNVSDGTVIAVAISVTMPLNNPVLTKITHPSGTHGTFTVSIGENRETTKSVIMARYYTPTSTHDFSQLCGCNALVAYGGLICDKYAVCGGSGAKSGVTDCNGDAYGNAYIDSCGVCAGGYSGVAPSTTCNPSLGSSLASASEPQAVALALLYKIIIAIVVIVAASCVISVLLYFSKWYIVRENIVAVDNLLPSVAPPSNQVGLTEAELALIGEVLYNMAVCKIVNQDLSYAAPESAKKRRGSKNEEIEEIEEEACASSECSICLMDINKNDKCRLLPQCSHLFHTACVDAWFKLNVHCPLCKRSLRDILNGVDGSGTHRTLRPPPPSPTLAPNLAPVSDPERGVGLRSESGHGQQTQGHGEEGLDMFSSSHRPNSSNSTPNPNPSAPGNPYPNPRAAPTVPYAARPSSTQSDSRAPHTQSTSSNNTHPVTIFQYSTTEVQDQVGRVPYFPPRRPGSYSHVSSNSDGAGSSSI